MAARKRNSVEPSATSESQMTYSRFLELFPDSDACLAYLKDRFYPDGVECPSCGKATKFHRIKSRAAYSCQYCRHQVYPTSGTIFHKSTTSLQLWFWAIYLMSSTRCGISAKQLEREIGVTYKTAHRMFKRIRTLLAADDDDEPLSGEVEMDETLYGGKPRLSDDTGDIVKRKAVGSSEQDQRVRDGRAPGPCAGDGRARPQHGDLAGGSAGVRPTGLDDLHGRVPLYKGLAKDFAGHKRIKHKEKVYVDGDVHTQTVEGFFGLVKNGIRGVYHAVSREYLQSYLDEYAFRYNARKASKPMFWMILDRVRKPQASAA